MRILIVSSYPPMACGIGSYAAQQAASLRAQGHSVDVAAPPEADGDFTIDFAPNFRPLGLARIAWAYKRIIVHYTPNFFYASGSAMGRAWTSARLVVLMLLFPRRFSFVIHETDYKIDEAGARPARRSVLDRWIWRLAGEIEFHSRRERDVFAARFGFSPNDPRLTVVEHGRHFVKQFTGGRTEARRRLGLPADKKLLLSIGFIQPHKGYDRAFRAFSKVPADDFILRVVGSVRIPWPPALEFAKELHALAAKDARAEFVESFVDDEMFDAWIAAADYVIVPYREIWSSSVAARAALFEKPVIASEVGGLVEQLPPGSMSFKDDAELEAILARLAAAQPSAAAASSFA